MALISDYANWAAWLECFGRGEVGSCDHLPAMRGEELGAPAAQRFATRCGEALDARLALWSESLDRDIGRASDAQQLRLCLVHARRRLVPIRQLTESPLIFEELQTGLMDALRTAVEQMQDNLARQAGTAHPDARETMIRVVRDVPLRAALDGDLAPETAIPATDDRRPRARAILLTSDANHG
jgi:hypothetical protein